MLNKRLHELHRVAQIALEAHRTDPDDEQTWADFQAEQLARDLEWANDKERRP